MILNNQTALSNYYLSFINVTYSLYISHFVDACNLFNGLFVPFHHTMKDKISPLSPSNRRSYFISLVFLSTYFHSDFENLQPTPGLTTL